jgi:hypothetical protein
VTRETAPLSTDGAAPDNELARPATTVEDSDDNRVPMPAYMAEILASIQHPFARGICRWCGAQGGHVCQTPTTGRRPEGGIHPNRGGAAR